MSQEREPKRAIERCKKAFGEGFTEGFAQGLAEGKKSATPEPVIKELVKLVPLETIRLTDDWNWYYCRKCRRLSQKICFCNCL